jgi:hypothetical protein
MQYLQHAFSSSGEIFTILFSVIGVLSLAWFLYRVAFGKDGSGLRVVLILMLVISVGWCLLVSTSGEVIFLLLYSFILNFIWVIRVARGVGQNVTFNVVRFIWNEIKYDLLILLIAVPTTFFTDTGRSSPFYSTAVILWFNLMFIYNYINMIICVVSERSRETLVERKVGIYCSIACMAPPVVVMLLAYGNIYRIFGLKIGEAVIDHPGFVLSSYFSVVTWTTLGYGDVIPVESSRLCAAAEAINGYIVFSVLTSALIAAVTGLYSIFQKETATTAAARLLHPRL